MSLAQTYKTQMAAIATSYASPPPRFEPGEAASRPTSSPRRRASTTNDWVPADEAWSKMNAQNSKWYVRIAPDEVYWDPCNQKAGFHITFARINTDSLAWQAKLVPVQQEMEKSIAASASGRRTRRARSRFHLPDFIDIVINAGDDRKPSGATVGQILPNWGPVAARGAGEPSR